MAVLNIWSPGPFSPPANSTIYIANPFGAGSNVWVQCAISVISSISEQGFLTAFGIIEYQTLDANNQVQTTTFGDPNNLGSVQIFNLPPRMYIPRMVSLTTVYIADNGGTNGYVTFFQWG